MPCSEPVPELYVQPGEWQLVMEPSILRTVLGSCVGITCWLPRLGAAALCHPMLPSAPAGGRARLSAESGRRYVDFAIQELAARFDSLGAARSEVQVKLFGGADVLDVPANSVRATVGKLNSEAALKLVHEEGFSLMASSLGGALGVNIKFNTGTGEVLLRRLSQQPRVAAGSGLAGAAGTPEREPTRRKWGTQP